MDVDLEAHDSVSGNKKRKGDLDFSLPTADEVANLKDTERLFKSNLFRLQIDELLTEVRENYEASVHRKLEACLVELKKTLEGLPERKITVAADKSVLGIPHQRTEPLVFVFKPPTKIDIVGSYLLRTVCSSDRSIDLAVEIPDDCLQSKDHLNMRYFEKRAIYVQQMYKRLRKQAAYSNLSVTMLCNDPLKPVITLQRTADKNHRKDPANIPKGFKIRLLPKPSDEFISVRKLAPNRNSLRTCNQRMLGGKGSQAIADQGEGLLATPFYNQQILEDITLVHYLRALYNLTSTCPAAVECILLLKVWLRQRRMHQNPYSLNSHLCSMLVLYLLKQHTLSPQMSAYQMLKSTLQFLADGSLTSTQLHKMDTAFPANHDFAKFELFQSSFDAVLVDRSTLLNVFFRVSLSAMQEVQDEAMRSLSFLNGDFRGLVRVDEKRDPYMDVVSAVNESVNEGESKTGAVSEQKEKEKTSSAVVTSDIEGFDALFMRSVRQELAYDLTCSLTLTRESATELHQKATKLAATRETVGTHGQLIPCHPGRDSYDVALRYLYALLECGLTDRATVTAVSRPCRKYDAQSVSLDGAVTVHIGILLNLPAAARLLDKGPMADQKIQASKFRAFWGQLSELRRFKDGTILEVVPWDLPEWKEHQVVPKIIAAVLHRHASMDRTQLSFVNSQFDSVVNYTKKTREAVNIQSPSQLKTAVYVAFKRLSDAIRHMNDVPLSVISIQSLHSVFRQAAPFPPIPAYIVEALPGATAVNQHVSLEPVDVVIQFERSSSWPDDLMAIDRIKSAFYIQLGASLGKLLETEPVVSKAFTDIVVNGVAFRLRIYHEREILMRQAQMEDRIKEEKGVANPTERVQLEVTEEERTLVHRPVHASMMRGLALRAPVFGAICQLAKRWVAAHMFSAHLEEEAIELLVASICHPAGAMPYRPPSSAITGFLRFLLLLSEHDWIESPIIINVDNDMTTSVYNKIAARFKEQRAAKTGAPMYIASPRDTDSTVWTRHKPSLSMLEQICAYARSSVQQISALASAPTPPPAAHWKAIFKTPLTPFHYLIQLNTEWLSPDFAAQTLFHRSIGDSGDVVVEGDSVGPMWTEQDKPVIGFDAVKLYLADLRTGLGRFADFFYDQYGGRFIGCRLKSHILEPRTFSVTKASLTGPVLKKGKLSGGEKVEFNAAEFVFELKHIGKGLVKSVVKTSAP